MRQPGQRILQNLTLHQQRDYPGTDGDYWIVRDDRDQFWDLVIAPDHISHNPALLEDLFWQTRDLLTLDVNGAAPFWGLWHDGHDTALVYSHLSAPDANRPHDIRQLPAATQAGLASLLRDLHGSQNVFQGPAHGQLSPAWIDPGPSLPFFGAESRLLAAAGKSPAPTVARDDLPVLHEWLPLLAPAEAAHGGTAVLTAPPPLAAPPLPPELLYAPPLFASLPAAPAPTPPAPQETPVYQQPQTTAATAAAPRPASPATQQPRSWPLATAAVLLVVLLGGLIGFFVFYVKPRSEAKIHHQSHLEATAALDNGDVPGARTIARTALDERKGTKASRAALESLIARADRIYATWRGTLNLNLWPPSATVTLPGGGTTSDHTISLPMGTTEYTVSAQGCDPQSHTVTFIRDGESTPPVPISLPRHKGTLEITSDPPGIDFSLALANSDAGDPGEFTAVFERTPFTMSAPTGGYIIEWRRPSNGSESTKASVTRHDTATANRSFTDGLVNITTTPPGAEIFHQGKGLGKAPMQIMLPLATTTLVAKRDGWPELPLEATPQVTKETRLAFNWPHGILALSSDPEGATFFINNTLLCKGNRDEPRPVGNYDIRAELPGLDPVTRSVSLADGEQEPVHLALAYGDVILESKPAGATIHSASGKQVGITPTILRQRPGRVHYVIKKPGYQNLTIKDTVSDGNQLQVNITLERR